MASENEISDGEHVKILGLDINTGPGFRKRAAATCFLFTLILCVATFFLVSLGEYKKGNDFWHTLLNWHTFLKWVEPLLFHMLAVVLELGLVIGFIEITWRNIEKAREDRGRRNQLKLIKSILFRKEMRNLFVANFNALENAPITLTGIGKAEMLELEGFKKKLESPEERRSLLKYKTSEAMEKVIYEYVKAGPVWEYFKGLAITYNFENVLKDMINIQHFLSDVENCQQGKPGTAYFVSQTVGNPRQWDRACEILREGIFKFLVYVIELKGVGEVKGVNLFKEMMDEYGRAENIYHQQNVVEKSLQDG